MVWFYVIMLIWLLLQKSFRSCGETVALRVLPKNIGDGEIGRTVDTSPTHQWEIHQHRLGVQQLLCYPSLSGNRLGKFRIVDPDQFAHKHVSSHIHALRFVLFVKVSMMGWWACGLGVPRQKVNAMSWICENLQKWRVNRSFLWILTASFWVREGTGSSMVSESSPTYDYFLLISTRTEGFHWNLCFSDKCSLDFHYFFNCFMRQLIPPLRTWPGETWAVASDVASVAECGGRIASTAESSWDLEIPWISTNSGDERW